MVKGNDEWDVIMGILGKLWILTKKNKISKLLNINNQVLNGIAFTNEIADFILPLTIRKLKLV